MAGGEWDGAGDDQGLSLWGITQQLAWTFGGSIVGICSGIFMPGLEIQRMRRVGSVCRLPEMLLKARLLVIYLANTQVKHILK